MTSAAASSDRLVLADLVPGALVRDAALVVGGAALTGLAAQVSITTSLTPVPFTLQTMAVLVTGAALGTIRALLSMTLYVAAGVIGMPWFASHGHGWGGPSFGYLLGFIVAAGLVGELARRHADRHVVTTVGLMVAGSAIIYLFGAVWLAADLNLSAGQAFDLGVRPFLISDAMKLGLAALAFPAAWKAVHRFRPDA
jgi:biotin transport system substrate-specific component